MVAYQPHKLVVVGSNPTSATMPVHIRGGYSINRSGNETVMSGSDDFLQDFRVKPCCDPTA